MFWVVSISAGGARLRLPRGYFTLKEAVHAARRYGLLNPKMDFEIEEDI
jgi:hypothetical protein